MVERMTGLTVVGFVLGLLGFVFVVVTAVGWLRAFVHRVPPAHGDGELAAELDLLAGRRTRRLAAAVIDPGMGVRMAFIGADKDTRFELGSVTKGFTGMLLAEAVRRGEVSLRSTVADVSPDTTVNPVGSVTLQELCTHTSGLPRLPRTSGMAARAIRSAWLGTDPYRGLTPTAVLEQAKRQRLPHRGQQRYSNLGAALLGQVLAHTAGSDYATLLTDRICAPIGMRATHPAGSGYVAPRGWTAAGRRAQPWIMDGYAPAGGLVSTVADLTLLATALLDGTAPGQAALKPVGGFLPEQPEQTSGMFWVIDSMPGNGHGPGRIRVWHNGQTGGYSAFLALYPQTRRAVIVLSNLAHPAEQQHVASELTRWIDRTAQP